MDDISNTRVLLAWQGKIYEVKVHLQIDQISITASQWVLSDDRGSFVGPCAGTGNGSMTNGSTVVVDCKNCQNIQIVAQKTVRDFRTGLCFPFILLRIFCTDRIHICLLQLCDTGVMLKGLVVAKPSDYRTMRDVTRANVALVDGPNVIYLYQEEIWLMNMGEAPIETDDLTKMFLPGNILNVDQNAKGKKDFQKSAVNLLGLCPVQYRSSHGLLQYLLIVVVQDLCFSMNPAGDHSDVAHPRPFNAHAYILTLSMTGSNQITVEKIGLGKFIPEIYCNLAKEIIFDKILVTSDNHVGSLQQSAEGNIQDLIFESQICAITSMDQIVVFENGKLCMCNALQNQSRGLISFENNADQRFYFIRDEKGQAVIIDGKELTVKETFEDINTGLVADFMNCGGEQILLVRSKEAEACPSEWCRFILIDYFSCRSVQQNTGEKRCDDDGEDSMRGAVRALENRLQNGMNYLAGVQCELECKLRLLRDVSNNMHYLNLGFSKEFPTQGLVPLVGDVGTTDHRFQGSGDAPPMKNTPEMPVSIYSKWQRVYEGVWIIGMNVKNTSKWRLKNLTAILQSSSHGAELESRSQIFCFHRMMDMDMDTTFKTDEGLPRAKVARLVPNTSSYNLPKVVHHLDPEEVADLVVLTRQPCFTDGDSFTVTVLLSWDKSQYDSLRSSTSPEREKDGEHLHDDGVRFERHSIMSFGRVELRVTDLLEQNLVLDFEKLQKGDFECQLVLEMIQLKTVLAVASLHHRINHPKLIEDQLGFTWSDYLNCWMHIKEGPLKHVRIYEKAEEHRRYIFICYYRDEVQLSVFLHALYKHLPDDAIVQSDKEQDPMSAVSSLLHAVLEESGLAQEMNSHLLKEEIEIGPQVEPTNHTSATTKEGVQAIRENFTRKQKQLKGVEPDTKSNIWSKGEERMAGLLAEAQERTDSKMNEMTSVLGNMDLF